ncbi:Acyl-CoAacyltransferase [Lactiplantibacillus pentosus KCA1]|nr:GNAT family N-acetyltransferase [Lactiplantibacillus pentosus]EIW13294.1 Acyl-CoAacyltransferase [Lactiplantibacillus pentosus KCA1]
MNQYRTATDKDIPVLARMAADAFKTDPFFLKLAKPTFQSQADYVHFLIRLYTVLFKIELKKGFGVLILVDGELAGAAFLRPILNENNLTDFLSINALKLFRYFKGGLLNRLLEQSARAKAPCYQYKDKQTMYLSTLMVATNYQGHHLGSRLLNERVIPILKTRQIARLVLKTSEFSSFQFFKTNEFKCFDEQQIRLNQKSVPNWSLAYEF